MTVKEYKMHLLFMDDENVIYYGNKQAFVLSGQTAFHARQLLSAVDEADYRDVAVPLRSVELAQKANSDDAPYKYPIDQTMVRVLGEMAPCTEPVTAVELTTLCAIKRPHAGVILSKLSGNGFVSRSENGGYLVSPDGHEFLKNHGK
jgi:hypothetical protein